MNFETRKILGLFLAAIDIILAFFLHGNDFGIFAAVVSALMLAEIWFKNSLPSGRFGRSPFMNEIMGWVFLLGFLIFDIYVKNN